jgi:hypothetical protein
MGETVRVQLALIIILMQPVCTARVTQSSSNTVCACPSLLSSGDWQETGVDVLPRSGDVLRVTRAASVQFTTPMLFRVIRVHDWSTYNGWAWLDGYELNSAGDAVERRSIFVQLDGLQQAQAATPNRYRASPAARTSRGTVTAAPLRPRG